MEHYLTVYGPFKLTALERLHCVHFKMHWNYRSWTARTASHMKHFQLLWDGRGTPTDWLGSALDIHSKSTETTLIDDCDEDSTMY